MQADNVLKQCQERTQKRAPGAAGDHSLTQGLKGDATYLVVNDKGSLENYGINGAGPRPCALDDGRLVLAGRST